MIWYQREFFRNSGLQEGSRVPDTWHCQRSSRWELLFIDKEGTDTSLYILLINFITYMFQFEVMVIRREWVTLSTTPTSPLGFQYQTQDLIKQCSFSHAAAVKKSLVLSAKILTWCLLCERTAFWCREGSVPKSGQLSPDPAGDRLQGQEKVGRWDRARALQEEKHSRLLSWQVKFFCFSFLFMNS